MTWRRKAHSKGSAAKSQVMGWKTSFCGLAAKGWPEAT
jgi:hypothetical protein